MNCDYAKQYLWIPKAVTEVIKHKITVVSLTKVDTSVRYFQRLVMEINPDGTPYEQNFYNVECRWIQGRVVFDKDGKPGNRRERPFFQSVVVIWSPK